MTQRIPQLDSLRGIASFAVCWFHLTIGAGSWMEASGQYGWLGVQVFFVISGFVIPYSLHRAGYHLTDYGRFILRRLVRLDPPYLITVLLLIATPYISTYFPAFRGAMPSVTLPQVLAHFAYINPFLGYEWLSPVFWTLAIEFQYYLLAGLIFPLLVSKQRAVRAGLLLALLGCAFALPSTVFLPHWLPLFCLGFVGFQSYAGLWTSAQRWTCITACCVAGVVTCGWLMTCVALSTLIVILYFPFSNPPLRWLGLISYSLYLTHTLIAGRVFNLAGRLTSSRLTVLFCGLAACLSFAYVFYFCFERPAQRLASRISLQTNKTVPTLLPSGHSMPS